MAAKGRILISNLENGTSENGKTVWTDEENYESRVSAMESLMELDKSTDELPGHTNETIFVNPDPDSVAWGKWGREKMKVMRSAAISSKTVYTYCFVHSTAAASTALVGLFLIVMTLLISIVHPLAIFIFDVKEDVVVIDGVEHTGFSKVCPRRATILAKILGTTLQFFFVIQTLGMCTSKLRGLNFLNYFVDLGPSRRLCVQGGMVAQCIVIGAASVTQFLLFIHNGDNLLLLVLQSLAMQFCLTVDQNIVSHQLGQWTTERVKAITADQFLATQYGGLGKPDGPMPKKTLENVAFMVNSETVVLSFLFLFGVVWSVALAICM